MVRRHELTDAEWARLVPLLPPRRGKGHPDRAHRTGLNGMLFRLHTGGPWRDLLRRYGKWQTVYSRWRRWTKGRALGPAPRHAPARAGCGRAARVGALVH
jgi:transposase